MINKICSKCLVEKSLDNFPRHKNGKYGRDARCKTCANLHRLNWVKQNPERAKDVSKRWRDNNKEQISAYEKEYKRNNPDKYRETRRAIKQRRRANLAGASEESATNWEMIDLKTCARSCFICGDIFNSHRDKTYEHIIPIYVGGSNALHNLTITCISCNQRRPKNGSDLCLIKKSHTPKKMDIGTD